MRGGGGGWRGGWRGGCITWGMGGGVCIFDDLKLVYIEVCLFGGGGGEWDCN